uniref:Uncharacterized protein n=1 Tax=Aegilops tauschii subsp. strangulata TaxID=200361 RepID=A0A453R1S4_AEGTS
AKHVAFSVGWSFMWVILFGLLFAGVRSYAVYKYSLQKTDHMLTNTPARHHYLGS